MPHIHAQIDFVVSCFIGREGRALLVNHKKLKTWLPVGGHIELHQTTDEAMDAEIREEAGIPVEFIEPDVMRPFPSSIQISQLHNTQRLRTPWAVEIHDFPGFTGHRHLAMIYFARGLSWYVTLEEEAHHEIRWFTMDQLDELRRDGGLLDTIHWYARHAVALTARDAQKNEEA